MIQAPEAASFRAPLDALPSSGWSFLQHMLPVASGSFSDSPCSCMIEFGDAMSLELLQLCKEHTLKSQKHHNRPELNISDKSLESVLVHVAALGCRVLQAYVDAQPEAGLEVEVCSALGLRNRSFLRKDGTFIAREAELAQVLSVVEDVFVSNAPASRQMLLVRGCPGLGKTAVATQGLRLVQTKYFATPMSNNVYVPSIIRGRGAVAVIEDLVRWGRDLGSLIGVSSGDPPGTVLFRLKTFLWNARYIVMIDDADEAGLQEVLKYLPISRLFCALVVTSQMLEEGNMNTFVSASESTSESSVLGRRSSIRILDLKPFTLEECNLMLQCVAPLDTSANSNLIYTHEQISKLQGVFENLARLPMAVRSFCVWLRNRFEFGMKDAMQKSVLSATPFDEAAATSAVVDSLLVECSGTFSATGAEPKRGLQETVKLALRTLKLHPLAAECLQLLAFLALCPPVQTPWSLFDGGGSGLAGLLTRGRRVVVDGDTVGHVSVEGKCCRIPKLKLEAVAECGNVEGGHVVVRLSNGKVMNVQGSDLVFEGDAVAVNIGGHWMLPRRLGIKAQGRVMREHADGSVSVLFQGPHEGCHVKLQGLMTRTELNGSFGYVCGAFDVGAQRWPVRLILPSDEVMDMLLMAGNLVCTGKVMARDGNGSLMAVSAFASGWLTGHRPGAEVVRFQEENVTVLAADGVLVGVTDALGDVAAVLKSSGLVVVDEEGRFFGMHRLLQHAVRAELEDMHDVGIAALLEARCGCLGDVDDVDSRMYGVMHEVVVAAGYVLDQLKAVTSQRSAWVCSMRVRLLQLTRRVMGNESREQRAHHDALDADLGALGAETEFRAMRWYSGSFKGDEFSCQTLISEVEEAVRTASDAAAGWDCRVALGKVQHMAGIRLSARGLYDRAIELCERALRIQEATLGEMHADTAATISSMGILYGKKGQYDRAIELFERALRIQVVTLGEMHADTAATICGMGTLYGQKGQYDRAIRLCERALRIQVVTLGEMHSDTAATISSMSSSYSVKGQYDRAIELCERALRIQMATLGDMHADTAAAISSMGISYGKKGQYDRAIELCERALRIQESTLGEMRADTAATISSIGVLHAKMGQLDLAVSETERALNICRQVLGPEHPQTQGMQQNAAVARMERDLSLSVREKLLEQAAVEYLDVLESEGFNRRIFDLTSEYETSQEVEQQGRALDSECAVAIFEKHGFTKKEWKLQMNSDRFKPRYQGLRQAGPVPRAVRHKETLIRIANAAKNLPELKERLKQEGHRNWLICGHALREATICLREFVKIVATALHSSIVRSMLAIDEKIDEKNKASPQQYDENNPAHKLWMQYIVSYHVNYGKDSLVVHFENCRANRLHDSPLDMIKLFCSRVKHTLDFEHFDGTLIFNAMTYCKEFHDLAICIPEEGSDAPLRTSILMTLLERGLSIPRLCIAATRFRNLYAHDYSRDMLVASSEKRDYLELMTTLCSFAVSVVKAMPHTSLPLGISQKDSALTIMAQNLSVLSSLDEELEVLIKCAPEDHLDRITRLLKETDEINQEFEKLRLANIGFFSQLEEDAHILVERLLAKPRVKLRDLKSVEGEYSLAIGATGSVNAVTYQNFPYAFKHYHEGAASIWKNELLCMMALDHRGIIAMFYIVVTDDSQVAREPSSTKSLLELPDLPFLSLDSFVPVGYLMERMKTSLASPICAGIARSNLLKLMIQAATAVAYCHANQVIHGDIKPDNILVNQEFSEVKLCDFGSATLNHDKRSTDDDDVILRGTWFFIAPEHLKDHKVLTHHCDIWSFGMTLWQVFHPLCTSPEEIGLSANMLDMKFEICMQGKRPSIEPDIPPKLKQLIEWCWNLDPAERPGSMDVVRIRLEDILLETRLDHIFLENFDDSRAARVTAKLNVDSESQAASSAVADTYKSEAAAEAEAIADAAKKANCSQTLQLLEQLGLQAHIFTFM
jgi:serine/threonine protein kinase/tetratricopeptide (TPR) repeat protein